MPSDQELPKIFDLKNHIIPLATIYGEAASEPYEDKVHVASSIYNRAMSGEKEFGADTGNITDVLQKGYYAYSNQTPKFMEALEGKFPDPISEKAFKEIVQIWTGLLRGKIKPTETEFFLTNKDIKNTNMKMDLLEQIGKGKTWKYFKRKPVPTKGRKRTATKR